MDRSNSNEGSGEEGCVSHGGKIPQHACLRNLVMLWDGEIKGIVEGLCNWNESSKIIVRTYLQLMIIAINSKK